MKNGYTPIKVTLISKKSSKERNRRSIDASIVRNMSAKNIGVKKIKKSNSIFQNRKIPSRDVIIFTENFLLLKKANFNNIHALSTIVDNTENIQLREIVEEILINVQAGENMYMTMEYYTDVFPPIYVNIIKVGELSGSLTSSLEQAMKYLEETTSLKKKINDILIPNTIQFVGLVLMLVLGVLIAIPQIQNVFDSVGSRDQLPAITLAFANFINFIIVFNCVYIFSSINTITNPKSIIIFLAITLLFILLTILVLQKRKNLK